jgi:S1-C subfamily serine protease
MKKFLLVLLLCLCGCSEPFLQPPKQPKGESTAKTFPVQTYAVERGETIPVIRVAFSYPMMYEGRVAQVTQHGSGSFVKHNGKIYIVTARHVVADSPIGKVQFLTFDKKEIKVTIVKTFHVESLDTTVYEVTDVSAKIKYYELGDVNVGDTTENIGFPLGGDIFKSTGRVLGISISGSGFVESGMSGGPVLKDGKLVGVITSKVQGSGGPVDQKSVSTKALDVFKKVRETEELLNEEIQTK